MPPGRKRAEVDAEPSRAWERKQSAVMETGKDVGMAIPFEKIEFGDFVVARQ